MTCGVQWHGGYSVRDLRLRNIAHRVPLKLGMDGLLGLAIIVLANEGICDTAQIIIPGHGPRQDTVWLGGDLVRRSIDRFN